LRIAVLIRYPDHEETAGVNAVFILNLALAFLIGGFWVAGTTLAADRFGSRIGGFIAALPSTVVVALFFIGWGQGLDAAVRAATVVPLSFANTGLFLLWFTILGRRAFGRGLGIGLGLWLAFSTAIVLVRPSRLGPSVAVYLLVAAVSWLAFHKLDVTCAPDCVHRHHSAAATVSRGVIGGLLVAATVALSKLAGPLFGGISAAFPAVFLTSLFFGYREHGLAFSRAMAVAMWRIGIVTIPAFALAALALFPTWGLVGGTAAGFGISVAAALVDLELLRRGVHPGPRPTPHP
jgi:hypothetical protein